MESHWGPFASREAMEAVDFGQSCCGGWRSRIVGVLWVCSEVFDVLWTRGGWVVGSWTCCVHVVGGSWGLGRVVYTWWAGLDVLWKSCGPAVGVLRGL